MELPNILILQLDGLDAALHGLLLHLFDLLQGVFLSFVDLRLQVPYLDVFLFEDLKALEVVLLLLLKA